MAYSIKNTNLNSNPDLDYFSNSSYRSDRQIGQSDVGQIFVYLA